MKIQSIRLRDFKRFTHLQIEGIPEEAKLVILAGPNGVGKSSLFEAFNVYLARTKQSVAFDPTYHIKPNVAAGTEGHPPLPTGWDTLLRNIEIDFYGVPPFNPARNLTEAKYQKIFILEQVTEWNQTLRFQRFSGQAIFFKMNVVL